MSRALFALVLILALSAGCRRTEGPRTEVPDPIEVDLDAAIRRAATERRPLFVHFTAKWCLPCKQLRETVYPDPAVASRLARFVRAEVDVESPAGKVFARRYGVQTVPALITISPQGEELRALRVVGATTADNLATILDKALEESGLERVAPSPPRRRESSLRH